MRNVATVGGSLAHADPHMDLPPVLIALGARVTVQGKSGERSIPVADLFAGYFETVLAKDELISSLIVPAQDGRRAAYLKVTTRAVHDWPALGVAVSLAPDGNAIKDASIVVSAADRRMIVLRNGVEIGSAPVSFEGVVDRVQAYVLQGVVGGDYKWRKVPLPGQAPVAEVPGTDEGGRFQGADPFRAALATVVGPGTTLVIIPDSLGTFSAPREQMAVLEPELVVPGWMGDTRVTSGR